VRVTLYGFSRLKMDTKKANIIFFPLVLAILHIVVIFGIQFFGELGPGALIFFSGHTFSSRRTLQDFSNNPRHLMHLRSTSNLVDMKTCTLRRATGLSEVLFQNWVAMVVAARCCLCGPLRPKVSTRNGIPNINII
jgi:hypothetical protein